MQPLKFRWVCLIALLAFAMAAPRCFAAAQLASGAKTSARPTSTNPQIRQCQITFDPDIIAGPNAASVPSYSLTGFQLSVQYDPSLVSVNDLLFVSPFVERSPLIPGATTGTPGQNYVNDPRTGLINNIAATADPKLVPPGQDVDIFAVDFTLNANTSFDTPLTFTIFANPLTSDFISGTDPNTGAQITTPAAGVEPTTLVVTFNQATAIANGTPLPSGAAAGAMTLMLLAGAGLLYRRRTRLAA